MVGCEQKSGDLKSFEGLPWSSWTSHIGTENPSLISIGKDKGSSSKKESNCVLLKSEDIGVYGRFPGTEQFLLARCKYCGDKFKIAAITEHIALRHSDGRKLDLSENRIKNIIKNDKVVKNKNKHKRELSSPSQSPVKNKIPKLMSDELKKPVVVSSTKDVCSDSVFVHPSDVPTLNANKLLPVILKSDSTKVKGEPVKIKKVILEKEARIVNNEKNSVKPVLGKVVQVGDQPVVAALVPLSKNKDKKTDNKKIKVIPSQTIKSCDINDKPLDEPTSKQEVITPIQQPQEALTELSDARKHSIKDKKGLFVKDRIYNPDRHCGVVTGKENAKPCTRSLTCKTHSISLRRAVRGRSKKFDDLLANHRAERETFKRKILDNDHEKNKPIPSPPVIIAPKFPFTPNSSNIKRPAETLVAIIPNPPPPASNIVKSEDGFSTRLSLPVSIKNPSLLSVIKAGEFVKPEIMPLKKPKLNGLKVNWDLTSDIVASLSKRVYQAPFSTKSILKQIKEKRKKQKKKKGNHKKQMTTYTQWNPWIRRAGGLLSTCRSVINVNGYQRTMAAKNIVMKEKITYESNGYPKLTSPISWSKTLDLNNIIPNIKDGYFKLIPDSRYTHSSKILTDHFSVCFGTTDTFGDQFVIQKKFEKLNLPRKIFRADDSDNSSSCSDDADNFYRESIDSVLCGFPLNRKQI